MLWQAHARTELQHTPCATPVTFYGTALPFKPEEQQAEPVPTLSAPPGSPPRLRHCPDSPGRLARLTPPAQHTCTGTPACARLCDLPPAISCAFQPATSPCEGRGIALNADSSSQKEPGNEATSSTLWMKGTAAALHGLWRRRLATLLPTFTKRGATTSTQMQHPRDPKLPARPAPPAPAAPRIPLTPWAAPSWRRLLGGAAEAGTTRPPSSTAERHCGRPAAKAGGRGGEGGGRCSLSRPRPGPPGGGAGSAGTAPKGAPSPLPPPPSAEPRGEWVHRAPLPACTPAAASLPGAPEEALGVSLDVFGGRGGGGRSLRSPGPAGEMDALRGGRQSSSLSADLGRKLY